MKRSLLVFSIFMYPWKCSKLFCCLKYRHSNFYQKTFYWMMESGCLLYGVSMAVHFFHFTGLNKKKYILDQWTSLFWNALALTSTGPGHLINWTSGLVTLGMHNIWPIINLTSGLVSRWMDIFNLCQLDLWLVIFGMY